MLRNIGAPLKYWRLFPSISSNQSSEFAWSSAFTRSSLPHMISDRPKAELRTSRLRIRLEFRVYAVFPFRTYSIL